MYKINVRWPKHEFISRDNFHLTNRFCKVELDPIFNSMLVFRASSIAAYRVTITVSLSTKSATCMVLPWSSLVMQFYTLLWL
jgi:hypothetical protein